MREPSVESGGAWSRAAGWGRGIVVFALRCVLVLVILEGTASLVSFTLALPEQIARPIAERLHTRYDADLGWVNIPDWHRADFYGPGRDLSLNAQGFRGRSDTPVAAPPDATRAICSGDSFTLGYGVGDAETWCAQLETLEPRLATVNMGQGGYGIDQAYLWYARDGLGLEHDLHIFSFIREDFGRIQSSEFLSYGKPVVRLDERGELVVRNVPVPRSSYRIPWLVQNAHLIEKLRIAQLTRPALRAILPSSGPELTMAELADLTLRIFEELQARHAERGSTLVLVYLPTREDYKNPRDLWRRRIVSQSRKRGMLVVDVVEDLKRLSRSEVAELYIPDGSIEFPGADGHFNEAGNAWVAERVLASLRTLPETRTLLAGPEAR